MVAECVQPLRRVTTQPRCRQGLRGLSDWRALLALSDEALASVDPLEMNLLVAKGIPGLSNLEIPEYQHRADTWAIEVARQLPLLEHHFLGNARGLAQ